MTHGKSASEKDHLTSLKMSVILKRNSLHPIKLTTRAAEPRVAQPFERYAWCALVSLHSNPTTLTDGVKNHRILRDSLLSLK